MSTPPPGQWPPPPPPQGPPPWTPRPKPVADQVSWGEPRPSSARTADRWRWVLGGLALLVVVVVTVVATLLLASNGSDGTSPPVQAAPSSGTNEVSKVASADDRSAVSLIKEDPTCAAWTPIARTLSERQKNGWDVRDPKIPRSSWTPQQRDQYDEVRKAMLNAADQTVQLAKATPHRVMRELYEQSVAYWRAYSNSLAEYQPNDDALALVANSTSGAIVWICASIDYGSAAARLPFVPVGSPPLLVAEPAGSSEPKKFMEVRSSVCSQWSETMDRFNRDTDRWAAALDPNIPASQWPPEVQALSSQMTTILQENADQVQNLGALSQNPTLSDFASLAAQYQRAYVQSIPSYMPADNYLNSTAAELVVAVSEACNAVGA